MLSCTNLVFRGGCSLKGSQALFRPLFLTPYNDYPNTIYLSPRYPSSKPRWYWLLAHSVSLLTNSTRNALYSHDR